MKKTKSHFSIPAYGEWFIYAGGYKKEDSHSYDVYGQRWAYDFDMKINDKYFEGSGNNLEDYYGYLQDIISPIDGFVYAIEDGVPNSRVYSDMRVSWDSDKVQGNHIIIKTKYGEYVTICHIEPNSFKVDVGDIVSRGQILAKVGNSGRNLCPHIHMQVNTGDDFFNSDPLIIRFRDVLANGHKTHYIKKGDYVQNESQDREIR